MIQLIARFAMYTVHVEFLFLLYIKRGSATLDILPSRKTDDTKADLPPPVFLSRLPFYSRGFIVFLDLV